MFKDPFLKKVFQVLSVILICMLGCRLSQGYFLIAVVLAGMGFAIQRKVGWMAVCYLFLPFFGVTNRVITSIDGPSLLIARMGGFALVLLAMVLGMSGKVRDKLPVGWIYVYLGCAVLSSMDGWFPMISYLKILNFAMMVFAICFIANAMQKREDDLLLVRAVMMAFAILVILGSALTRLFPSVGFSMQMNINQVWNIYLTAAEVAQADVSLFNGVTWHSQTLSPLTAIFAAWVLCDMLLVEKRFAKLHVFILLWAPIVLFWTRSRTGFVAFCVSFAFINFFGLPRANISRRLKGGIQGMFLGITLVLALGAGILEMKDHTISRWLRKTDDVGGDTRSLADAVMSSRMGLVELSMHDFRLNPMLGMGFQVMSWHPAAYRTGAITLWSAPVEKGVLPAMVLGEGGIVGFIVFSIFLLSFYVTCYKRRYVALPTMLTSVLASNMGEATFFSPSGAGGILWVLMCVGGLCVDVLVLHREQRQMSQGFGPMSVPPPPFGLPPPMGRPHFIAYR